MAEMFKAIVLLIFSAVSVFSDVCPHGFHYSLDTTSCYAFINQRDTFDDAEKCCQTHGGHLASISNALENSVVAGLANTKQRHNALFWIGGKARRIDKKWTWTDNSDFMFSEFHYCNKGDCSFVKGKLWGSTKCERKLPYVCEVRVDERPCNGSNGTESAKNSTTTTTSITTTPSSSTTTTSKSTTTTTTRALPCPESWIVNINLKSCYKVLRNVAFEAAEDACLSESAHLASVHNDDENNFIAEISRGKRKGIHDKQTWIGLRRPPIAGDHKKGWFWTDKSKIDYTAWDSMEPNGIAVEYCAAIYSVDCGKSCFKWYDMGCDTKMSAVCKKPAKL